MVEVVSFWPLVQAGFGLELGWRGRMASLVQSSRSFACGRASSSYTRTSSDCDHASSSLSRKSSGFYMSVIDVDRKVLASRTSIERDLEAARFLVM